MKPRAVCCGTGDVWRIVCYNIEWHNGRFRRIGITRDSGEWACLNTLVSKKSISKCLSWTAFCLPILLLGTGEQKSPSGAYKTARETLPLTWPLQIDLLLWELLESILGGDSQNGHSSGILNPCSPASICSPITLCFRTGWFR